MISPIVCSPMLTHLAVALYRYRMRIMSVVREYAGVVSMLLRKKSEQSGQMEVTTPFVGELLRVVKWFAISCYWCLTFGEIPR